MSDDTFNSQADFAQEPPKFTASGNAGYENATIDFVASLSQIGAQVAEHEGKIVGISSATGATQSSLNLMGTVVSILSAVIFAALALVGALEFYNGQRIDSASQRIETKSDDLAKKLEDQQNKINSLPSDISKAIFEVSKSIIDIGRGMSGGQDQKKRR